MCLALDLLTLQVDVPVRSHISLGGTDVRFACLVEPGSAYTAPHCANYTAPQCANRMVACIVWAGIDMLYIDRFHGRFSHPSMG